MPNQRKKAVKNRNVFTLNNNGTLELDPDDGTIRYVDVHGNSEGVWEPGDDEYDHYRQFFPEPPSPA